MSDSSYKHPPEVARLRAVLERIGEHCAGWKTDRHDLGENVRKVLAIPYPTEGTIRRTFTALCETYRDRTYPGTGDTFAAVLEVCLDGTGRQPSTENQCPSCGHVWRDAIEPLAVYSPPPDKRLSPGDVVNLPDLGRYRVSKHGAIPIEIDGADSGLVLVPEPARCPESLAGARCCLPAGHEGSHIRPVAPVKAGDEIHIPGIGSGVVLPAATTSEKVTVDVSGSKTDNGPEERCNVCGCDITTGYSNGGLCVVCFEQEGGN